jgi:hypothetical protein
VNAAGSCCGPARRFLHFRWPSAAAAPCQKRLPRPSQPPAAVIHFRWADGVRATGGDLPNPFLVPSESVTGKHPTAGIDTGYCASYPVLQVSGVAGAAGPGPLDSDGLKDSGRAPADPGPPGGPASATISRAQRQERPARQSRGYVWRRTRHGAGEILPCFPGPRPGPPPRVAAAATVARIESQSAQVAWPLGWR